ncbi:MAG: NADP-dependent oxidoreductase [Steroidobacteraceae bacterium]
MSEKTRPTQRERGSGSIELRRTALCASAAALLLTASLSLAAAQPPVMRAIVFENATLELRKVQIPQPGAMQVRVQVRAAGVNPIDWKMADGFRTPNVPGNALAAPTPPAAAWTPGFDAAGVIVAVGANVTNWKVGDEVFGQLDSPGSYAQYALLPASAIARKPAALSFERAAGIPSTGSAAWAVVVDQAKVRAGQRVLVQGGAGGVGSAAVQIAKSRGAYVIATALKAHHGYLRKTLGVDEVIDYETQRFEDHVKDVDLVINTVNAEVATRSIAVTRRGGAIISLSGQADATRCAAAGVQCALRAGGGTPKAEVFAALASMAAEGRYDIYVEKTFALKEASQAWDHSRLNATMGKLIMVVK